MKLSHVFYLCALVQLTLVEAAFSQGVPTAVSILPSKSAPATPSEEPEGERYERRVPTRRKVIEPEKKVEPKSQVVEPNPEMLTPLGQSSTIPNVAPVKTKETHEEPPTEAPVTDQMRDAIIGGSQDQIDQYTAFLNPDDIRRNRVELSVAPQFVYNESTSDYYYRRYVTATPGGRVGLGVWFTPFFGLAANYEKSFLGTMRKNATGASQTPFMDSTIQMGLRFRRFSSHSITSPSLTLGVDYLDYQKKVPIDDPSRNRLQTSGVLLSAESRMPSNENTSWIFGLEYMPVANHREFQTSANIQTGTSVETFRMGANLGVELKLDRTNRLFFKLKEVYEKNSFSGPANTADPTNGDRPENIAVINNFLIFEIGYVWGH